MASEHPFSVEHAKSNRSRCKETKEKIAKGELRICREVLGRDDEPMSFNYSLAGFTDMLAKARKVRVDSAEDEISGFSALTDEEQQLVIAAVEGVDAARDRIKAERAAARKAKAKVKAEAEASGSPAKKKKGGVKKERGAGGAAVKTEATPATKKKVPPAKPVLDATLPQPQPGQTYTPKEMATMLLAHCRAVPDMNRTLPAADDVARKKLGGFITSSNPTCLETGLFDLQAAFDECVDGGVWKPRKRKQIEAAHPENQALVSAFEDYAGYAFKESVFKGNNLMKATRSMAEVDFKITSGAALSKGKTKLAGIGKGTGEKIDQFLETGQIEALETLKAM